MARPRKTDAPDLTQPCNLTVGAIERLTCPPGKRQAFLRDLDGNGLKVRVTANGAKAFVFEQSLKNQTVRRTLGSVDTLTIAEARAEARRLAGLIDDGIDPRELDREQAAAAAAEAERKAAQEAADATQRAADAVTVGEAWARYIAERRPRWGARTYADHVAMTDPGGVPRKRMPNTVTKPAPLASLMGVRLCDLDGAAVETWAVKEAPVRPARVRLALRMLKAFLRWAAAEPDLKPLTDPTAASARKAREAAGKPMTRDDVLERGQLKAWFQHVRQISSPVIAAYVQVVLLTGARPGEVLTLKWDDVNVMWKGMTIRDKVEGERQIPLTPYVESLLARLPRRNAWVFSSTRVVSMDQKQAARRARYHAKRGTTPPSGEVVQTSESGRLIDAAYAHGRACAAAGLGGLTLHGLRRSFASLTEWLEIPAGVVAQIQGHKPSATAEKHYKRRPLDLLRVHHERIETWILEQAGIAFDPDAAAKAGPTLVAAA